MRKILAIILSMAVILSMTIVSMPAAMASGTITGDTYQIPVITGLPSASDWSSNRFTENDASIYFGDIYNTTYSYTDGKVEIDMTPTDSGSSMYRFYFGKAAEPQSGIYTYSMTGYMDGAVPNKINLGTKVDGSWNLATASYESGFAKYVYEHTRDNEAKTPFTISFVVDTYNYTMTSYFNETKCVIRDAFTGDDGTAYVGSGAFSKTNYKGSSSVGKVTTIYFEPVKSKATDATKLVITDAKITIEKNAPAISSVSYVKDGTEIAKSDWASGLFDENADEIKVYLTETASVGANTVATLTKSGDVAQTLEHALSADGKSLTLTLPDGKLANGDYTLSIANLLADGMTIVNPLIDTFKVEAEPVVTASTYEVAVFDGLPETTAWKTDKGNYQSETHATVNGLKFNIFRGVDSGVDKAPVTVNTDKTLTIDAASFARLQMYYPVEANNGKVIYELRGKFDKAPGAFKYHIKDAAGTTLIYTYSEWTGFETYINDLTKEYVFTLEYDTDLGAMQLYLNGVAIENDMFREDELSKTGVGKPVYFEFVPASGGSQFTITGYKVALLKNTPQFDSLGYVLNGTEKNLKTGEKVPAVAKSIVLNYTGEVGSDIKTSVKLLKDGAEVSATYKTDGSKVIVTPADGFGNGNYTVSVSGLSVSAGRLGENFNVSKSFETESVFAILSPETDVLKNAENVKLAVSLPVGYTYENLLFFIDGVEQDLPDENCTLTLDSDNLAYGDHVFTAKLYAPDDEDLANPIDEVNTKFELQNNRGKENIHPMTTSTSITTSEGSDGSADGGVKIAGTGKNQGWTISGVANTSILFVEADIKRAEGQGLLLECKNEKNGSFIMLGNIGNGSNNVIETSGKIGMTSAIFPANEWHNFKLVYNTATYQSDMYLDGKLVASGTNSGGQSCISTVKFYTIAGSTDNPLPLCVDNLKYGVYDVIPSVTEVSYTTASSTDVVKADGKKISVLANKIALKFDRAFDSVSANAVTVNGETPTDVTVDGKTVTITPAEPLTEGNVKITFQSGLLLGGTPTDKAVQVLLETEGYLSDNVGDIVISADKKSASVKIIKAVSGSTLPESVDFIIAAYQGDRLMKINVENKPLTAENGENNLSVSLPSDFSVEGLSVKAFIWNMGTMAPIK